MVLRVQGASATIVPFGFFRIREVEWKTVTGQLHLAVRLMRLANYDESALLKQFGGVVVDYAIADFPK